jgi:hypothetical protein
VGEAPCVKLNSRAQPRESPRSSDTGSFPTLAPSSNSAPSSPSARRHTETVYRDSDLAHRIRMAESRALGALETTREPLARSALIMGRYFRDRVPLRRHCSRIIPPGGERPCGADRDRKTARRLLQPLRNEPGDSREGPSGDGALARCRACGRDIRALPRILAPKTHQANHPGTEDVPLVFSEPQRRQRPGIPADKKSPISQRARRRVRRGLEKKSGGDLLSHAVSREVPSALEGLTAVFGMGTGVTPPK